MPFYVYSPDRPGISAEMEAMVEAHWAYMDQFAGRLILRGPTLSADGEEHTGSVHLVDLPDQASADRFATEEPFWRAGCYERVTAARAVVLLHREPVDDPLASGTPSALVTGHWPARPGGEFRSAPADSFGQPIRFVAALVDDDESRTTGVVMVVSAVADEAVRIAQPFANRFAGEPVALTVHRWQRGGRS
jgi:uncharacterized protein YciI